MADLTQLIEINELLDKLRTNGFSEFVDAFLLHETKVYTKKGRLNKSGACRVLDYKPKQLDDILASCRKLLEKDISVEEEPQEDTKSEKLDRIVN